MSDESDDSPSSDRRLRSNEQLESTRIGPSSNLLNESLIDAVRHISIADIALDEAKCDDGEGRTRDRIAENLPEKEKEETENQEAKSEDRSVEISSETAVKSRNQKKIPQDREAKKHEEQKEISQEREHGSREQKEESPNQVEKAQDQAHEARDKAREAQEGKSASMMAEATGARKKTTYPQQMTVTELTMEPEVSLPSIEKPIQEELQGLNQRLFAYTDRIKENDAQLRRATEEKLNLQRHIEEKIAQHNRQVAAIKEEIYRYIAQIQTSGSIQRGIEYQMILLEREMKAMQKSEKQRNKEFESLQRALSKQTQLVAKAQQRLKELSIQLQKENEEKQNVREKLVALKIRSAELQQDLKFKTMEYDMQQNRMTKLENKHSAHDEQRIAEAKAKAERVRRVKLDEQSKRHAVELAKQKEDFRVRLLKYTTAKRHAKLKAQVNEAHERAQTAELNLQKQSEEVSKLQAEISQLEESKEALIEAETKRTEKLNRRLSLEKRKLEEIRDEVATYRRLIEQLNPDGSFLEKTPENLRQRATTPDNVRQRVGTPLKMSDNDNRNDNNSNDESTELKSKVLTPTRLTSNSNDENRNTEPEKPT